MAYFTYYRAKFHCLLWMANYRTNNRAIWSHWMAKYRTNNRAIWSHWFCAPAKLLWQIFHLDLRTRPQLMLENNSCIMEKFGKLGPNGSFVELNRLLRSPSSDRLRPHFCHWCQSFTHANAGNLVTQNKILVTEFKLKINDLRQE